MDLDNAKENIQPLASGRNIEILETAISAELQHDVQEKINEQRKEYERIIQEYKGDDPLGPWYDYIQWIEQSYPKSGKETALNELLGKCLSLFENDERYKQDRRMIKLYIKYIDGESNPPDFYKLLYKNGIGTMVADLYLGWAHYYDFCDKFEKAESIYLKGIEARAQPLEQLQEAHRQFGFSMSQRLLHKDSTTREKFLASMEEQRLALTSLRADKGQHIGSIRTGTAIKNYNPGKVEQKHVAANSFSSTVPVYQDENIATTATTQSTTDTEQTLVKQSIVQTILNSAKKKENLHEPGPWTKAKMSSSKSVISNCSQKLPFLIMKDDDLIPLPDSENMYAKGIQLPSNFAKENLPQSDFKNIPLHRDDRIKALSLPGYDKILLFPNEKQSFSPEELGAYKYFKQRGIENSFTKQQDTVWGCGHEVPIRLPPLHPKENDKQQLIDNFLLSQFNPFETQLDDKKIFGFNINKIYSEGEENSFEEFLCFKWVQGELKSQKANEMEITCNFNRRESIFPSAIEKRRSIIMGNRGSTVTSNTYDTSRQSIYLRKSIMATSVDSKGNVDHTNKAPDSQPPNENVKEIRETTLPKPKFDIFEDLQAKSTHKNEDNVFKTPYLPPSVKPRPSINFQDGEEDTCTTQTFNFYIKPEAISTPKAIKQVSAGNIRPIDDNIEPVKRYIVPNNENLSPINSLPQEIDHRKQPFAIRNVESDMKDNDCIASQTSFELRRQKLSAIMETTEDATSTTTISSKSSSSEESDCSKRAPLPTPSLSSIPETNYEVNKSEENVNHMDSSKITEEHTTTAITINTVVSQKGGLNPPEDLHSKNISIYTRKTEQTLPPLSSLEEKTEDLFKLFDKNQTMSNKSVFAILSDNTIPSMCPLNIIEEKTDTVPRLFACQTNNFNENQSTNQTVPPLDEFKESIYSNLHNMNANENVYGLSANKSVFCVDQEHSAAISIPIIAKTKELEQINILQNSTELALPQMQTINKSIKIYEDSINADLKPKKPTEFEEKKRNVDEEFFSLLESPIKCQRNNKSIKIYEDPNTKDLSPNKPTEEKKRNIDDEFYSLLESPIKYKTSNIINSKSLFIDDKCKSTSAANQVEKEKSILEEKQRFPLILNSFKNDSSENLSNNLVDPSDTLLMKEIREPSMSLLEPMKEQYENNHKFLFSDEIPNTAQFSLNMASIKNSTVLSECPITTDNEIKIESIHIKEEAASKLNLPSDTSLTMTCDPKKLNATKHTTLIIGDVHSLEEPFQQHSVRNRDSAEITEDFNITGVNLNQSEMRCLMENEQNLIGRIQISEPRTIRPSTFQYTLKSSSDPMEMTFKEPTYNSEKDNEQSVMIVENSLVNTTDTTMSRITDSSNLTVQNATDINPFDSEVQEAFLHDIDFKDYINGLQLCSIVNRVRPLEPNCEIAIANKTFQILNKIAEGSYGFVYRGKCVETNEMFALKQERPPNLWEFYISLEIHTRIENQNVLPGFMSIDYALIGSNASVFVTKYYEYGSLVNIVNRHKASTLRNIDEVIVMIFANQMLSIVDHLHGANIIHGDIKPDNFLVMKKLNYGSNEIVLKLIDYGHSIDMNFFKMKTFTAKLDTKNFICTEMIENKPWTFQLDLFCLASTIFSILCGKYMNVKKQPLGFWPYTISDELPANTNKALWTNMLHTLINVRNENSMPNLQNLRLSLKEAILAKEKYLEDKIKHFNLSIGNNF